MVLGPLFYRQWVEMITVGNTFDMPPFDSLVQLGQVPLDVEMISGPNRGTKGDIAIYMMWGGHTPMKTRIKRQLPTEKNIVTITNNQAPDDAEKKVLFDGFGIAEVEFRDDDYRHDTAIAIVDDKIRDVAGNILTSLTIEVGKPVTITFYAGFDDTEVLWTVFLPRATATNGPVSTLTGIVPGPATLSVVGQFGASASIPLTVVPAAE